MNSQPPFYQETEDTLRPRAIPRSSSQVRVAPSVQPPGLQVGDIYYAIFRHKWRIVLCALVGIIAASAIFVLNPPQFSSEAKLFVRYVFVDNGATASRGDAQTRTPDQQGETIMDSEQEILTSLDLAKQVAQAIGPELILAKAGGGNELTSAAMVVQNGLKVEIPPHSSVLRLVFFHPDPSVVQPVLNEIVSQYLKMHLAIHQAKGMVGDFLTQETDQLRGRLLQTDEELRKARNKAGVISIEDTKDSYSKQMARIRSDIYAAQAELAEKGSVYQEITKRTVLPTPAGMAQSGQTQETPVPQEKMTEFRSVSTRLDLLRKREQDLLDQFTPESARVINIRALIAESEATRDKILAEYPRLLAVAGPSKSSGSENSELANMSAALIALQSKITELNRQYEQVKVEAARLDEMSGAIEELKRRKDLQEANYRYYSASLEQSRINEALGAGKVSNISQIQAPSPPAADRKKTTKLAGGVLVGGFGLGILWAFFIELYLDRSVRRPADVERFLGVPLFLSIPVLNRREKRRLRDARAELALAGGDPNAAALSSDHLPINQQSAEYLLYSFHETLRDRLIGYFESQGLTHKPKLVAVTGLGRGTGVTTTASGLASSLSQTGEGNVLLVDMTMGQGSAHHFYRGEKVIGLDEILSTAENGQNQARNGAAQVQDNLFVVGEEPGQDKLSRILPQRFTKLVPKLKASNFDYIIFDMPPVSQISITPRLAGFMDMVLLVIESEKTDRELVQRATALLAQSKAHVGAVLNKNRIYVPSALHQDYLGNS